LYQRLEGRMMSETDELDRLREQRRRELLEDADAEVDSAGAVAPTEPIHVDDAAAFEETVAGYDVVLVDFYADWCGPCKMVAPVVEELARETDAAVVKVDVDANGNLAQEYRVQGVPTLLLFVDGEPEERIVGVRGKDELAGLIAQYA
jgi:thioredoxin 1